MRGSEVSIRVVKCSEVMQCSGVLLVFYFFIVVYMVVCFVYFCLIL